MYKSYGIYAIKNTRTDMVYVGQTINNFGDRRDHHYTLLRAGTHTNTPLQQAWNEACGEDFDFIILYTCNGDETKEDINQLEMQFIKKYKDLNLAYNISDGGDTSCWSGKHLPEDVKRKIGDANRINMTGKKASEETKQKMSRSQKERYANMSEEEKQTWGKRSAEYASGYSWSDESKRRFAEKQRTKPNSAKYTIDQVREMRKLHEVDGYGASDIGKIMGIPAGTVRGIITYKRWAHID